MTLLALVLFIVCAVWTVRAMTDWLVRRAYTACVAQMQAMWREHGRHTTNVSKEE